MASPRYLAFAPDQTRCVDGRTMRHDPQPDDPGLETDIGQCEECSGDGCDALEAKCATEAAAAISALDLAWAAINSLGGTIDQRNARYCGFVDAIDKALVEIEMLGGGDPLVKMRNLKEEPTTTGPTDIGRGT